MRVSLQRARQLVYDGTLNITCLYRGRELKGVVPKTEDSLLAFMRAHPYRVFTSSSLAWRTEFASESTLEHYLRKLSSKKGGLIEHVGLDRYRYNPIPGTVPYSAPRKARTGAMKVEAGGMFIEAENGTATLRIERPPTEAELKVKPKTTLVVEEVRVTFTQDGRMPEMIRQAIFHPRD